MCVCVSGERIIDGVHSSPPARTARLFLESQHEEAPLDFIIVQDQASMAADVLQQNNRLCDTPNCSCSKLMVPHA
jgi:hypothetical protein